MVTLVSPSGNSLISEIFEDAMSTDVSVVYKKTRSLTSRSKVKSSCPERHNSRKFCVPVIV